MGKYIVGILVIITAIALYFTWYQSSPARQPEIEIIKSSFDDSASITEEYHLWVEMPPMYWRPELAIVLKGFNSKASGELLTETIQKTIPISSLQTIASEYELHRLKNYNEGYFDEYLQQAHIHVYSGFKLKSSVYLLSLTISVVSKNGAVVKEYNPPPFLY